MYPGGDTHGVLNFYSPDIDVFGAPTITRSLLLTLPPSDRGSAAGVLPRRRDPYARSVRGALTPALTYKGVARVRPRQVALKPQARGAAVALGGRSAKRECRHREEGSHAR